MITQPFLHIRKGSNEGNNKDHSPMFILTYILYLYIFISQCTLQYCFLSVIYTYTSSQRKIISTLDAT